MGRARVASRVDQKLGGHRRIDTYLTRSCETWCDQVFQWRNVQGAQFSALPLCNSQGKHAIGKLFGNRLRMCLQRQPTPQVPETLEPFKLLFAGIVLLHILPNILSKALCVSVLVLLYL